MAGDLLLAALVGGVSGGAVGALLVWRYFRHHRHDPILLAGRRG